MTKFGIIGSRRRDSERDMEILVTFLQEFLPAYPMPWVFVSGGCPKGADRFAELIAKELEIEMVIYYPDKSQLPENPQKWDYAKIMFDRNTTVAQDSDVLIALVAPDRKGGTEDTIKKFKKFHKLGEVIIL